MADRPDHDLADRLDLVVDRCLMHDTLAADLRAAAARLRQLTDETPFVTKYVRVPDERDELRRQLDTLRSAWQDMARRGMEHNSATEGEH